MVVGDVSEQVEVVVLGGGPGGYAAAFRAADLGKKVALVEQDKRLGGVCLLRGCIPSKAMISVAELLARIQQAGRMGIVVKDVGLDIKKLAGWRDQLVQELADGIAGLAKARGVRRILGRGAFRGPNDLHVAGEESMTLRFQHAVIAVGSRPVLPSPFKKAERIITSDEALTNAELPESLLVVGGGYIGIELGTAFAALGSKVTVVEMLDRLLTGTDDDLVRVVQRHMEKRGIDLHLGMRVVEATPAGKTVRVRVEPTAGGEGWTREFSHVLVAIGRRPNTDDLGLDRTGIKLDDKGHILIDEQCRTTVPHLYAIGDCTGQPYLAHRASRQAVVAAETIAGHPAAFDNRTVPAVVFSDPEIAYCGLSEEEAKKAGYEVRVGRFRFAASGRAKTLDQTDGLVNVIAEAGTEVILGVRMVGPQVSELLGEATLAVETGAVIEDLAATIHAHPTLHETLHEAAEAVRGQAIHTYRATGEPKARAAKAR